MKRHFFTAMLGRRRLLAARLVGLAVVKCEAYETGTPQLKALLSLIENEQRSAAWVKEVQDLRSLIDEGVGMTLADLAAFGFERNALGERLKMALLPQPLVELICAGKLSQEVAKKIARLNLAQQASIARLAEEGDEITAEQVRSVLRAQINTGFAPLQTALAQSWSHTVPAVARTEHGVPQQQQPTTGGVHQQEEGVGIAAAVAFAGECSSEPRSLLTSMLAMLQQALPQLRSLDTQSELQRIHLLTATLIQHLQVALREGAMLTSTNDPIEEEDDDEHLEDHLEPEQDQEGTPRPLCLRQNGSTIYEYRPTGEAVTEWQTGFILALPITGIALIQYADDSVNEKAKAKVVQGLDANGASALPFYETPR